MTFYSDVLTTEQNAEMQAAIDAAIAKERAACAKIARDEARHQRAIAERVKGTTMHQTHIDKAATAERIARAIERGER